MARPRKTVAEMPATEREIAPVTVQAPYIPPYVPPARAKQIERQGSRSEPFTTRYPRVVGGTCEYCGVLDRNVPSQYQYKMCGHYRGMELRCSYCPENKDPDEIVAHASLNIAASPNDPNTLIVWCDSYECSKAHEDRFRRSRQG